MAPGTWAAAYRWRRAHACAARGCPQRQRLFRGDVRRPCWAAALAEGWRGGVGASRPAVAVTPTRSCWRASHLAGTPAVTDACPKTRTTPSTSSKGTTRCIADTSSRCNVSLTGNTVRRQAPGSTPHRGCTHQHPPRYTTLAHCYSSLDALHCHKYYGRHAHLNLAVTETCAVPPRMALLWH
jgi:hypothetical protein